MGKKSRVKKEKKHELGRQAPVEAVFASQMAKKEYGLPNLEPSGLEKIFLLVVRFGAYLALFTPLVVYNRAYFPFVGPKSLYFFLCSEITIFSWLGLWLVSKKYRPNFKHPLTIALGVLFLVLTLASLFGVDFVNSFWSKYERMTGLLMWLHLGGFFLALVSVFKDKVQWKRFFALSVFVALLAAMVSFLSAAFSEKIIVIRNGKVNLFELVSFWIFFLPYLVVNFALAMFLFFKRRWKHLVVWAGACFFIIVLVVYYFPIIISTRGGSTLGNSSFMGTYLLFNIFFALYLFCHKRERVNLFKSRGEKRERGMAGGAMVGLSSLLLFFPFYRAHFLPLFLKPFASVLAGRPSLLYWVDIFKFSVLDFSFALTCFLCGLLTLAWLAYSFWRKRSLTVLIKVLTGFAFVSAAVILFLPGLRESAKAASLSVFGGLALLFLFWLAFSVKYKAARIVGRAILVFIFIGFIVSAILLLKPEYFHTDSDNFIRQAFVDSAGGGRLVVWENAWAGFKEKPFLGWGLENYEFAFVKNFNPCMFLSKCGGEIWFDRAHNIVFDRMAVSGILGLLTYIGFILTGFFLLWKRYLREKISFLSAAFPFVILIAYSVQNLTVFDMVSSYLMFFLVLGFVAVKTEKKTEKEQALVSSAGAPSKKYWLLGILAVVFLGFVFEFVVQPWRANTSVINAIQPSLSKKEQQELRLANPGLTEQEFYQLAAQAAAQKRPGYYRDSFSISPLGAYQIREFLAQNTQEEVENIVSLLESGRINMSQVNKEAIIDELEMVSGELEKTLNQQPLDFRANMRLAHVYNAYCLFDNLDFFLGNSEFFDDSKLLLAEQYGLRCLELSPTNQQGYWVLAQTRIYQGRYDEALQLAEQAIALNPEVQESINILEQVKKFMPAPSTDNPASP